MGDSKFRPFKVCNDEAGVWMTFCIRGVHLEHWSQYIHHHGGSTGYRVAGRCDGSCKEPIPADALALLDRFRQSGERGQLIVHESPADTWQEDDEFGGFETINASCCGETVSVRRGAPCPSCGAC
jgi:hypothetical protein